MKISSDWQDYKVLATGDGEKLEVWGNVKLLRPDPQVIWHSKRKLCKEPNLNAHYIRESTGGGHWDNLKPMPSEWQVSYKNLKFLVKPMGFKHTGLFPEQAVNWDYMIDLIKKANRPIKVLNLFGYTGGATVACTYAGAEVTHVDASKGMVDRCKQNIKLSGLQDKPIRYIVDDCKKFVEREIKRGKFYDAIIMDPPSYGRGPSGEMWKIEDNLYDFVELCKNVLSDKPLFVLINSYTTGLQPMVLRNLLNSIFEGGETDAYEVGLKTEEADILLPCGASGIKVWKN
ncbi:MAG: SAM-dependent methyltransferase [Clostridiales bacterium]|nr:SAM-dependent methyltransferase [Clostridiales bacterium]